MPPHIFDFAPHELTSLLESLLYSPTFTGSYSQVDNSPEGAAAKRRLCHRILLNHALGSPTLISLAFPTLRSSQFLDKFSDLSIQRCKSSLWTDRFEVLREVSKSTLIHLDLLHDDRVKAVLEPTDLREASETERAKADTSIFKVVVTLQSPTHEFVEFKREETLGSVGRNRLVRQFGSEHFLVVQFVSPFLSLSDKLNRVNALKLNEVELALAVRQYNLFAEDEDRVALPQHTTREALQSERLGRFDAYTKRLKLQSGSLHVAGRDYRFLLTTTAGVHKQKMIYTDLDRGKVLQWAFSEQAFCALKPTVLKLSLRLALLNSISIPTVIFSDEERKIVDDIVVAGAGDKPKPEHILTDGCGCITQAKAKAIFKTFKEQNRPMRGKVSRNVQYESDGSYQHELHDDALELPASLLEDNSFVPSAYQIRFGGFKGMLVVVTETVQEQLCKGISAAAPMPSMLLPRSMLKFQTPDFPEHRRLEVLGCAFPSSPVTLNNEIVDMLIGVATDSLVMRGFLKRLVTTFLDDCNFLLADQQKALAYYLQEKDDIGVRMLAAGHSLKFTYLTSFFRSKLIPLHIPLPSTARLYGVADWSSLLPPGHVYVNSGETGLVSGDVVMLKEPCFLRTDIQRFKAIDRDHVAFKQLCHLRNVVVFSTASSCTSSDASAMAGSDLDGDKFIVCWDQTILDNVDCQTAQKVQQASGNTPEPMPPQTAMPSSSEQEDAAQKAQQASGNTPEPMPPQTAMPSSSEQENADPFVDASDVCDKTLGKCFDTAMHSTTHCSLADLLHLRMCYIDSFGDKWCNNQTAAHLGQLLSQCVDAPKNDTWVPITEARSLLEHLPPYPRYHRRARKVNSRVSKSIRGTLFDVIIEHVAKMTELKHETWHGTLQDSVDVIQAFLAAERIDSDDPNDQLEMVVNRLAAEVHQRNALMEHVALYSLCWKFINPFSALHLVKQMGLSQVVSSSLLEELKQLPDSVQNMDSVQVIDKRLWTHKVQGDIAKTIRESPSGLLLYYSTEDMFLPGFKKLRLCRSFWQLEQDVIITRVEEILALKPDDGSTAVKRFLHAFRSLHVFTPEYRLHKAVGLIMRHVLAPQSSWIGSNSNQHSLWKMPKQFNGKDQVDRSQKAVFTPDVFACIQIDTLNRLIALCSRRLEKDGWQRKRSRNSIAPSDELLDEVNQCIKHFNKHPRNLGDAVNLSTLSRTVNVSPAAAILALISIGRGEHWLFYPGKPKIDPSPVRLWHGADMGRFSEI
ncbi:hypothetical protein CAOG_05464 [Capsaspora owczarzaki ATCC 30864]|nr:hypothetical protein CAOG_05464 [Capsaspora owczarzaki ATCC 30864]|eukprot:XP_004346137.1 hypothetical protein CAOG_05464 [Capsaspora owczarzaki ATCC 30864]